MYIEGNNMKNGTKTKKIIFYSTVLALMSISLTMMISPTYADKHDGVENDGTNNVDAKDVTPQDDVEGEKIDHVAHAEKSFPDNYNYFLMTYLHDLDSMTADEIENAYMSFTIWLASHKPHQTEVQVHLEDLSRVMRELRDLGHPGDEIKNHPKVQEIYAILKENSHVQMADAMSNKTSGQLSQSINPEMYANNTISSDNVNSLSTNDKFNLLHTPGNNFSSDSMNKIDWNQSFATQTKNIKLGMGAYLKYPAIDIYGIVVHLLIMEIDSEINSNLNLGATIMHTPHTGVISFMSEICLNDAGTAETINFKQTHTNYVYNVFHKSEHSFTKGWDRTFDKADVTLCVHELTDTDHAIRAGAQAGHWSGVKDITVT